VKRIGFIGTGWTDIGQIKAFKKSGLIPQAIYLRNFDKAKRIADKYHNESFENPTLNDCLKNQQIIDESYKRLTNK